MTSPPRSQPRPASALLACAVALLAALPARAQDCPTSTFLYGGIDPSIPIPKAAPRVDTTFSPQACDRLHGRYDVQAGLLIAAVDQACVDGFGVGPSGIETVVEDDFILLGLPPGIPVACSLAVRLEGEGHSHSEPGGAGGARLRGTLLEGASNSVSFQRSTNTVESSILVSESLVLPISAVIGTPFRVRMAVRAEAFDGRGRLDGLFRIQGLPPGVRAESCRGYSSSGPVPARSTTWGRLKARYR